MSNYNKPQGTCCCTPPTPGLRMLTFPDGTQSGVFGLDEIFAAVYAEGRLVGPETTEEIVERLAAKNYIAPSARQRYCDLLVDEYGRYVENRLKSGHKQEVSAGSLSDGGRGAGLLSRLFRRRRLGPT
jgi:hypothetical protein